MHSSFQQRINYFVRFGGLLSDLAADISKTDDLSNDFRTSETLRRAFSESYQRNKWFTRENLLKMIRALAKELEEDNIANWLNAYDSKLNPKTEAKKIALIMAGNIPLVGFHDLFCVMMSGHKALVKPSSDDALLLPTLWDEMRQFDEEIHARLEWAPLKLAGFDAAIATGSNNSARYFEHYFGKYPHIIRKNRNSLAVLEGDESEEELHALGDDIFSYFGLGCRNVTKLMLPKAYDMDRFFKAIYDYSDIINHNKYANNYDYHKALWLLNKEELLDNGFLLLKESEQIASPVGSLFYQLYDSFDQVESYLSDHEEEIQCIVGKGFLPFGEAQSPALWDYADRKDTMKFLLNL